MPVSAQQYTHRSLSTQRRIVLTPQGQDLYRCILENSFSHTPIEAYVQHHIGHIENTISGRIVNRPNITANSQSKKEGEYMKL
jgi:hypothetical protein